MNRRPAPLRPPAAACRWRFRPTDIRPADIVQALQARARDAAEPEHWLLTLPVGALRTVALSLGANRVRVERAHRPELLAAIWRRTAWRVFPAAERPLALKWGGTFRSAVYIEIRGNGAATVYADVVYPPAAPYSQQVQN